MSARKSSPVRRDGDKERLDAQTPYTTFLPAMDEGFHVGYQPAPGVQHDRSRRPGEWLKSMARFMRTEGEDVGYSIPDVLAGEQQLKRLMGLPNELAMRQQQFIDYRATLALLLLWDFWQRDDTWPTLNVVSYDGGGDAFSRSVLASLTPARAPEGIRLFTLTRTGDGIADERPLCLISDATAIVPAADAGDLSDMLPKCVRWYDRARKRFTDPCEHLNEAELSRLSAQLRALMALNERLELHGRVYSRGAELCPPIARFLADLIKPRLRWRERLQSGDDDAENDLRTRLLSVLGSGEGDAAAPRLTLSASAAELSQNPLIKQLLPTVTKLPSELCEPPVTLYLLKGVPFARRSDYCELEPTRFIGEDDALRASEKEIDLRSRFSAGWNARVSDALYKLRAEASARVGFSDRALALIGEWADERADVPVSADRSVTLTYPIAEFSPSLAALLTEMLGLNDNECVREPFSDCLLIVEGAERPPFEQAQLARACVIRGDDGDKPRYAVPPLSERMCAWLAEQSELDDPCAARLKTSALRFEHDKARGVVYASFRVVCRARDENATTFGSVTFKREYRVSDKPESGAACAMRASDLPYVVSWPHARITTGLWRQYFVYAHRPEAVDVLALTSAGWSRGVSRTASDEGTRRQSRMRAWQIVSTDRFPAYVALKRGALAMGALPGDRPRQQLKLEPPAIISLDFGSIATTIMMRQGDKVQPAVLPRCLHHALLWANENDERFLADELLPRNALLPDSLGTESSYYSVMDMFTDDPDKWRSVMADGHIYYRESLSSLLRKSENTLYYDLKWGEDDYVLRSVRLFLLQAMTQASLSARLWGSGSVSWRVSMPNALPAGRQEAYLELVRGLAREVADASGIPLTKGCPAVLYASENRADGLYFRDRNEVNARNGYINMDIGGGTTDISLWLGGAAHATAECSLRLGCRQMLFDSISMWHITDFGEDFADAPQSAAAAAKDVAEALGEGVATTRGRQKSMFLLDDFFAEYSTDIRAALQKRRAEGKASYVECLLLFNVGFLFAIAGTLVDRAWREAVLKPLIPSRMELCVAGNGGQFLKLFTDEQREKLCALAVSMLTEGCPLKSLTPVQSRNPKQEVAIGLLSDEELQSSVTARARWNGAIGGYNDGTAGGRAAGADGDGVSTFDVGSTNRNFDKKRETGDAGGGSTNSNFDIKKETGDAGDAGGGNLLISYLPQFARLFPQASARLMRDRMSGTRLNADAQLDAVTIYENEREKTPDDDMATYARCLGGLKRLWRI